MRKYLVQLDVDYNPKSNRKTVLFRLILVIPILILLGLLVNGHVASEDANPERGQNLYTIGFVVLPTLLMILFRRKYPRWWFDWNLELVRFSNRISAYFFLLRDEYPSTDEEQAVHIQISYPNAAEDLNRWLPLVKWFLVLPHIVLLAFLWAAVLLWTILAWIVILLDGSYPRTMFDFVVGVHRWSLRVGAYAMLMVTDVYPPFRLND